MRRVRLLRQPFPLLLGAAPAPVATLHGLPVGFALTGAKADERQVLLSIFTADDRLLAGRHGQLLIADKNYYGHQFEHELDQAGLRLLRPTRKGERCPVRCAVLQAAAPNR